MFLKKLFADHDYRSRHLLTIDGEGEGEMGGGGGDSGNTDQSPQVNGEQQGQQADGQNDTPAQGGQQFQQGGPRRGGSDWIPKHRFDQVNRGYQTYKRFGSPEEIQAKLAMLEKLQQKPENRYDPQAQEEIRQDFLRLFPEMRSVVNAHKTQTHTFVASGVKQNDNFLRELNLEVSEANNHLLQDTLGGIIDRDPDLRDRFYARDPSVFADAFKQFKQLMKFQQQRKVPGLQQQQQKTKPSTPANRQQPPAKPKDIKPGPLFERETLDEASERAFAQLAEQVE